MAARKVNETLVDEEQFPDLQSYISQGISNGYEIPSNPAWMPFQKLKQHDLPTRLLDQANNSGVAMMMGIFPALGHAWAALDNSLYIWDYSMPNPELIGWEDNSYPITAVNLVPPRPGVFVEDIAHLLVVTTSVDMTLLGVATTGAGGAKSVVLYNTRMSIQVRGLSIDHVVATRDGRILMVGDVTDDIYEFQYQQDEGWFRGRTARICLTKTQFAFVQENMKTMGQYFGPRQKKVRLRQLAVDNTRNLLYGLTSENTIRFYALRPGELIQAREVTLRSLLQNASSIFSRETDLLHSANIEISSLSCIPAPEAEQTALMVTMNTGVRLYLNVTRGYGHGADATYPPANIQILHMRFPPNDPNASMAGASPSQQTTVWANPRDQVNIGSKLLTITDKGVRFPPGYFLAFLRDQSGSVGGKCRIFCSAPDTAKLKNKQDSSQVSQRYTEHGQFVDIPGTFFQVMDTNTTGMHGAIERPVGYANELAIQFDEPSAEIAVVTSSTIQMIRRRRVVDVFAGIMRYGASEEEGREGDVKRFARLYGREETTAAALAVACGQGMDVGSDSRLMSITDPEVIEGARKAFIEQGGTPSFNANAVPDNTTSQIDLVRPSARHQGIVLYISRLVRSIWRARIIKDSAAPGQAPNLGSTIALDKLRTIQREMTKLQEFLETNKSFIQGLNDHQPLGRTASRQDEVANQGEHRAMHSVKELISRIIEGISFVIVLFDNGVNDILGALGNDSRQRARELTFEWLFVSAAGRELAKELVKAIVNRNIASGSNVDTVAEQLRRRCGSFCSADDVIVFKAQEQVKRASEAGGQSETGRVLLNESQRLFQRVAGSLNMEHLQWAVQQYVQMAFFAGAIELCLVVADEKDRARRALAWLKDGMEDSDPRREAFGARKGCYDLIFATIEALDEQTSKSPETMDGQYTVAARRRNEAYDVVNSSEDAVFQTCLYDWYVSIGQSDRLLDIDSQYVVDYLKRRSLEDRAHADMLWRYHAHHNDYLQAASVQLDMAKGYFDLNLEERIEYLSRARTNASTRQTALMDSRQSRQQLLREVSDLLDVANIQSDILERMKAEPRLTGQRREEVLSSLNGPILPIDELFNQYADQASYHDICIQIYQVADHRNPADIKSSWQNLIEQTDSQSLALHGKHAQPWEAVGEKVRELGRKLNGADSVFPIQILLPMLERYAIQPHDRKPPPNWAVDLFLDLDVPHETLLPVLEGLYYGNEHPFVGSKRRLIAAQMIYLLKSWFGESERRGERIAFGSEENASLALDCAATLLRTEELDAASRRDAEWLTSAVQRSLR
jgi:nuclear pore complex protein Nup155